MYIYSLQGLHIGSEIKLSELKTIHPTNVDATIQLAEFDPFEDDSLIEGIHFRVTKEAVFLFWRGVGSFKIKNGEEILVNPEPSVEMDAIIPFVFSPALAVLLHQRGRIVLHASAVEIGGEAVAFLGDSGFGKSTTAMVLQSRGYSMVADDVLSIDLSNFNYPVVYAGMPVIKLCKDVTEFLSYDLDSVTEFHRNPYKNFYYTSKWINESYLKLKSIYILHKGNKLTLTNLNRLDALMSLVINSFLIRIFNNQEKTLNLKQCSKLLMEVPLKQLTLDRSLKKFEILADLIEEDVLNNL